MINHPLVSVVMPTYNRAEFLSESIESILKQTFKDFEFIIIDDGSTDNSDIILKSYAQKDSRIKIIKNKTNLGRSPSRNIGNAIAKGKYIAVMDSDDISLPNRLAVSVRYLEKNKPLTLVCHNYYTDNTQSSSNWMPTPQLNISLNVGVYPIHHILVKRDFLVNNAVYYDESLIFGEDYDLYRQIYQAGGKLAQINTALSKIRIHHSNPEEYYALSSPNINKIRAKFLSKFGINPNETLEWKTSDCLKFLYDTPFIHDLDREMIRLMYCTIKYGAKKDWIYIKHYDWLDYLVPTQDGKWALLHNQNKKCFIHFHPKYMQVFWETGEKEKYLKQANCYSIIEDLYHS